MCARAELTVLTRHYEVTKESDWICRGCGHEWVEEVPRPSIKRNEYTTLLACMSVGGGPDGCSGCFNAVEQGGKFPGNGVLHFYCNECGRHVFDASLRRFPS